jgi:hypothetical protein
VELTFLYMRRNTYVDVITKKSNNTLAFFKRRNIGICPQSAKERALTTFVRPTIEYTAAVLDPPTQRNISALERVQRIRGNISHEELPTN